MGYYWDWGMGDVGVSGVDGGGGSQRLLSLNPTTVLVVLLLALWLLLGCDNKGSFLRELSSWGKRLFSSIIFLMLTECFYL